MIYYNDPYLRYKPVRLRCVSEFNFNTIRYVSDFYFDKNRYIGRYAKSLILENHVIYSFEYYLIDCKIQFYCC